mgnify:CR=1 FL=1
MKDLKDIREVGTAKGNRMVISLNQVVFNAEDGVNSREFVIKDSNGNVVEYVYVDLNQYSRKEAKTPAGINEYSFAVLTESASIDIMHGAELDYYDGFMSYDNFDIFEDTKLYNAYVRLINKVLY